jgi:hypothetical protein
MPTTPPVPAVDAPPVPPVLLEVPPVLLEVPPVLLEVPPVLLEVPPVLLEVPPVLLEVPAPELSPAEPFVGDEYDPQAAGREVSATAAIGTRMIVRSLVIAESPVLGPAPRKVAADGGLRGRIFFMATSPVVQATRCGLRKKAKRTRAPQLETSSLKRGSRRDGQRSWLERLHGSALHRQRPLVLGEIIREALYVARLG